MPDQSADAALDALIRAVAARNLAETVDCLSYDPTVVGSETDESANGSEAVEAFFRRIYDRPGAFVFEFPNRSWTVHGDVAWLVAGGTVIEPGASTSKPYRLTAVFISDEAGWRLALWSGAEPVETYPGLY